MSVPSASTTTASPSAASRKVAKAAAAKAPAQVKQTDGTAPVTEPAAEPAAKVATAPADLAVAPVPAPEPGTAPAILARNQSLPLVTVGEIQAAAQVVSTLHHGKQRMAYLAGRSAASLDELKTVVRSLAKVGRLHPDALAMLAEGDADDARSLLETADGANADVGGAVRDAMRESILADFEHSVDVAEGGEGGDNNARMVRDVYRGPWRSSEAATGTAAETAAEVSKAASETEDVLDEDAPTVDSMDSTNDADAKSRADAAGSADVADTGGDHTETTPLDIALDIAAKGEVKSETASDASGKNDAGETSGEPPTQTNQE